MEIVALLLSGLLGGLAPVGVILDTIIAGNLRARLPGTDTLAVRIDNAPSYQLLSGKVQRLRIAGRGVQLTPDIRVAAIDLETDPLNVDLESLREGSENWRTALREPVQAGLRLELSEADFNQTLASPQFTERLQGIASQIAANLPGAEGQSYELADLNVDFRADDRLRLNLRIQGRDGAGTITDDLLLSLETGITVTNGRQLELDEPVVAINEQPLPPLFTGFATQFIGE
ncbi:MAG: DUF2993 domain-containing protein, partial [Spirulinaceae cyanobacterium RM2_2_10]|nr:DUF2993 domain-containing protein [Spirulinaceae cyanobacterium RM2_2_10]